MVGKKDNTQTLNRSIMVRTKANNACARKGKDILKSQAHFLSPPAVAAKAPRKALGGGGGGVRHNFTSPSSAGRKKGKGIGGNPVRVQPTPAWQKGKQPTHNMNNN